MLCRYLYKLAVNVKQRKWKVAKFVWVFYVVFLLIFFKNFRRKTRAKFVYKEIVAVVKITST